MQFDTQTQCNLLEYRPEKRYAKMSTGRIARAKLLYWGVPLTRSAIGFRRSRVWLERFESIIASVFGLSFLGWFAWLVLEKELMHVVTTRAFWWDAPHLYTMLVWCAFGAWCFVIYRSIARKKDPSLVEAYASTTIEEESVSPLN